MVLPFPHQVRATADNEQYMVVRVFEAKLLPNAFCHGIFRYCFALSLCWISMYEVSFLSVLPTTMFVLCACCAREYISKQNIWGNGGVKFGPSHGPRLGPALPPKGPTKPRWPTTSVETSVRRYIETVRRSKVSRVTKGVLHDAVARDVRRSFK